jgi:hypothetical protein
MPTLENPPQQAQAPADQPVAPSGDMLRRTFMKSSLAAFAALAIPEAPAAAQAPSKAVPYGDALSAVTQKLDKEVKGGGFTIRVASSLMTSEEVNTLAQSLVSGIKAPNYIAKMPTNFSEVRLDSIAKGLQNSAIPYINHENQAFRPYSIASRGNSASDPIVGAEEKSGLVTLGITPLDHPKALYAVAVKDGEGNQGWILAQITKGFIPIGANGFGPSPKEIRAALPEILSATKK